MVQFVLGDALGWLRRCTHGQRNISANLYSLIETAKANGLEPYRYLCHLFQLLPSATSAERIEDLLPRNVKFD